ncbi:histidine kinase [Herbidospora sp. NBRC 101105]|uniref:sensor histidine kinase n=1 Tax=Herbidospora sp. NBRC 101105 TaxID=3032195 RepID=UPI002556600A|nr:histidine kinase [Herbidospora sp. NBRC 101105]
MRRVLMPSVAVGLALWAVAEAAPLGGVALVFAVATTAPIAFGRQAPLPVLLVIVAALLVRAATTQEVPATVAPFPSILVMAFCVALFGGGWLVAVAGWVAAVGGMAGAIMLQYYTAPPDSASSTIMVFFVTAAWASGLLVARREEQAAERARSAVAEERLRIARELHDVVAHSLSIIAVNAGAAQEVPPERARAHLDAVADTARAALAEMRQVLHALRADDDPALGPQPTLDELPDLLDQARAGGLPVTLEEEGVRRALPAGLELTAYRIVQEALTNVRRHAGPAATRVRVAYGERLDLEVVNAPGHGLIGMRERARLYGGALHAAPSPDGGFAVRVSLDPRSPEEPR